jgi:hypothetical protein
LLEDPVRQHDDAPNAAKYARHLRLSQTTDVFVDKNRLMYIGDFADLGLLELNDLRLRT